MASGSNPREGLLQPSTLRNLSDKVYEKRKAAALEVEQLTRDLVSQGDKVRLQALVDLLVDDFALAQMANHRKGGLIGLAAATVGLGAEHEPYLARIVPPVLESFEDNDSRVRYYACEALYNIAKVARTSFVAHFNEAFDALLKLSADTDPNVQNAAHLLDRLVKDIVTESTTFKIDEFIPVLRERLHVLNPYARQFLVGWITVLDSVPDIDMLEFLPEFLDGLLSMLSDENREIRQQADVAIAEFLLEIKKSPHIDFGRLTKILVVRAQSADVFTQCTATLWLLEFLQLGGDRMLPYFADVLGAILPLQAHAEEQIRDMATTTFEELLTLDTAGAAAEEFSMKEVLEVSRRELAGGKEATRLAALRTISTLLERSRDAVLPLQGDLLPSLLGVLSDDSEKVTKQALVVQADLARDAPQFGELMSMIMEHFKANPTLLDTRGFLIVTQLAARLGPERVYRACGSILLGEQDRLVASTMVQALNVILVTAPEMFPLRKLLRNATRQEAGRDLFMALYDPWCHSPIATVTLCLIAQCYPHAADVMACFCEIQLTVETLVQADQLIQLLETPIFTFIRMQLLEPARYPSLVKTLYGLLMLLPQSETFNILQKRLGAVPTLTLLQLSPGQKAEAKEVPGGVGATIPFKKMMEHFRKTQEREDATDCIEVKLVRSKRKIVYKGGRIEPDEGSSEDESGDEEGEAGEKQG